MEYCIGSECYNPNSFDGLTGEEGREFRYPVYFKAKKDDNRLTITKYNVAQLYLEVGIDSVNTMKYMFGSNNLFVGNGIMNLIEKLENRYGIDFNELEEHRKRKELFLIEFDTYIK